MGSRVTLQLCHFKAMAVLLAAVGIKSARSVVEHEDHITSTIIELVATVCERCGSIVPTSLIAIRLRYMSKSVAILAQGLRGRPGSLPGGRAGLALGFSSLLHSAQVIETVDDVMEPHQDTDCVAEEAVGQQACGSAATQQRQRKRSTQGRWQATVGLI
eukprot:536330-Amphidinium_carterae.2